MMVFTGLQLKNTVSGHSKIGLQSYCGPLFFIKIWEKGNTSFEFYY